MDCPPGQKNVAVLERWPLVEVRLYMMKSDCFHFLLCDWLKFLYL